MHRKKCPDTDRQRDTQIDRQTPTQVLKADGTRAMLNVDGSQTIVGADGCEMVRQPCTHTLTYRQIDKREQIKTYIVIHRQRNTHTNR